MTRSLDIQDLPLEWFQRPQYKLRLDVGGTGSWFLLSPDFAPASSVPRTAPREPPAGRPALRSAFEETYSRWDIPRAPATQRALDEISASGTAVVVAGQQPGFLGGPLHTVFKAMSAIAAARRHRELAGRPCVPVFWVAADDHDFEEVRDAHFPGPGGTEATFRFPGEADRRPLSEHAVGAEALEVLDLAAKHFADKRFAAEALSRIDLYRGRSLAGGFAALVASLFGDAGLLVLDPEAVRPLAGRILRGAIEDPAKILERVEAGRAEVEARGLKPLVAARLPLFHLRDGKRHHLSPAPGGLEIDGGGPTLGRADALRALDADPRCFGPGALLRPIVQEECLPCILSIGGPAEVGYFAQLGPLAEHFGLARPAIALRFNATLLEGKLVRAARALGLDALARAQSPQDLLPSETEPEALRAVRELRQRAGELLDRAVGELAPASDAPRLQKHSRDITTEMDRLADRLSKARAASRTREVEEARKLWAFLFPSDALQERRWGVLHFVAKHGVAWLDEIIEHLSTREPCVVHRLAAFEA